MGPAALDLSFLAILRNLSQKIAIFKWGVVGTSGFRSLQRGGTWISHFLDVLRRGKQLVTTVGSQKLETLHPPEVLQRRATRAAHALWAVLS